MSWEPKQNLVLDFDGVLTRKGCYEEPEGYDEMVRKWLDERLENGCRLFCCSWNETLYWKLKELSLNCYFTEIYHTYGASKEETIKKWKKKYGGRWTFYDDNLNHKPWDQSITFLHCPKGLFL